MITDIFTVNWRFCMFGNYFFFVYFAVDSRVITMLYPPKHHLSILHCHLHKNSYSWMLTSRRVDLHRPMEWQNGGYFGAILIQPANWHFGAMLIQPLTGISERYWYSPLTGISERYWYSPLTGISERYSYSLLTGISERYWYSPLAILIQPASDTDTAR